MKKTISTESTRANIAQVIALLADTPGKLDSLSAQFQHEQFRKPPGLGERSFTEVLAHLIHCEARSSEAIYLALLQEEPLLAEVHPERQWGKLLRFDLLDFSDLLVYFRLRRAVLSRVLRSLKERQWERAIRAEGKKREESVYWLARSLAVHELEHLSELEGRLSVE